MRLIAASMLFLGLVSVVACSGDRVQDIPNNDSEALVEALRQANASGGHTTIRLARNGLYILATEAEPGLLLPAVVGRVTIEGNHAEIRGYSPAPAALLEVDKASYVTVRNLVLAEGTDGAVRNYGDLRLHDVAIVDSSVDKMPAILLNHGRIEATNSEIAYNLLLATRRDAGTVLNYGEIELTDSRIHSNRALGREPTVAVSGGILNFGSVKLDGLQLEDNELPADESPRLSFGGILNLGNGSVTGRAPVDSVRDASHVAALTGH